MDQPLGLHHGRGETFHVAGPQAVDLAVGEQDLHAGLLAEARDADALLADHGAAGLLPEEHRGGVGPRVLDPGGHVGLPLLVVQHVLRQEHVLEGAGDDDAVGLVVALRPVEDVHRAARLGPHVRDVAVVESEERVGQVVGHGQLQLHLVRAVRAHHRRPRRALRGHVPSRDRERLARGGRPGRGGLAAVPVRGAQQDLERRVELVRRPLEGDRALLGAARRVHDLVPEDLHVHAAVDADLPELLAALADDAPRPLRGDPHIGRARGLLGVGAAERDGEAHADLVGDAGQGQPARLGPVSLSPVAGLEVLGLGLDLLAAGLPDLPQPRALLADHPRHAVAWYQ
mmetsp:Transcript_31678/g.89266  ORF Transcript_31678/g.89266 Transcript_31678/m.89266 type:complete len:343 (+) Transcript_31678:1153-2181(+)